MTRPNSWRIRSAALVVAIATTSCGLLGRQPGVHVGPDGLRTFTVADGVLCTLGAATDPLTGTLAGEPLDPERLWLVDPDANRTSVVWPEGFSVRFEPTAVLYDDGGRPVARAGDVVSFGQVSVEERSGTSGDPYWASGLVFDGCYVPA